MQTERLDLTLLEPGAFNNVTRLNDALNKIDANVAITPEVNLLLLPVSDKVTGAPGAAAVVMRYEAVNYFYFPAGMNSSRAKASTVATGSSVFSIKKNGVQFATMTFAVAGTVATFAATVATSFVPGDELTIVAPNPADATLANIGITLAARYAVPTNEAVSFTSAINATATGNSLQKSGGSGVLFDAGAVSIKALQYGAGAVRFKCTSTAHLVACGLSKGDTNQNYTDIDFAWLTNGNGAGKAQVYEGSVLKYSMAVAGATSDVFEIRINGTAVEYWVETAAGVRTLHYTSATALTSTNYPLLVDTSLRDSGSQITSVMLSGVLA
ncbi:MAG: hypothetical protein QOG00_274 [Pyrinomonadaceae bacterium]|nr:hypothetical protein [Pyrinomonadaceae bacterium]